MSRAAWTAALGGLLMATIASALSLQFVGPGTLRLHADLDLGAGVRLTGVAAVHQPPDDFVFTLDYASRPRLSAGRTLGLVLHVTPADARDLPAAAVGRGYLHLDFLPEEQPSQWVGELRHVVDVRMPHHQGEARLLVGTWDYGANDVGGAVHEIPIDLAAVVAARQQPADRWRTPAAVFAFVAVLGTLVLWRALRTRTARDPDWSYAVITAPATDTPATGGPAPAS